MKMEENITILKNRKTALKAVSIALVGSMVFFGSKAAYNHFKLKDIQSDKSALLALYESETPDTLKYFREKATPSEQQQYDELLKKEKETKEKKKENIYNSASSLAFLGLSGYARLINEDIIDREKKRIEREKEKDSDREK